MTKLSVCLVGVMLWACCVTLIDGFSGVIVPSPSRGKRTSVATSRASSALVRQMAMDDRDDQSPDPEGANLAAEFFRMAQQKGINLEKGDILAYDDDGEGVEDVVRSSKRNFSL